MGTTSDSVETDTAPNPLRPVQYLGYASGDVANNLTFTLVSMFLLVYYTDVVGIAAGAAGTVLFVARVWGAFTDVFAGRMVDKTTTRWGRFRPYFLFGAVPLMLLAVATFSVPGGFGDTAMLVYAYASYMLAYPLTEERFRAIVADLAARSVDREGRPTGWSARSDPATGGATERILTDDAAGQGLPGRDLRR